MEYKVVELREGFMSGKMSARKLEKELNKYAADGWRFQSMNPFDIKGRTGPGDMETVVLIFERD